MNNIGKIVEKNNKNKKKVFSELRISAIRLYELDERYTRVRKLGRKSIEVVVTLLGNRIETRQKLERI